MVEFNQCVATHTASFTHFFVGRRAEQHPIAKVHLFLCTPQTREAA